MSVLFLRSIGLALAVWLATPGADAATPLPQGGPAGPWMFLSAYSDEFNGARLDEGKWILVENLWPSKYRGSYDSKQVAVEAGELVLRIEFDAANGEKTGSYKKGAVRMRTPIRFGYFETRVKASRPNPGTCTAFWAHRKEPGRWTEIDFMEHGQWPTPGNERAIWHTLHVFKPPFTGERAAGYPQTFKSYRQIALDAGYHFVGCEWSEAKIDFYVDGELVGSQPNLDFKEQALDLDMSIELREPYLSTLQPQFARMPQSNANYPVAQYPAADTPAFAPVARFDYVRVWQRVPQPEVEVIAPKHNATVSASRVVLEATAHPSDASRPVTRVEFYEEVLKYWPEKPLSEILEKRLIGTVTAPPYRLPWKDCAPGHHAIRAIACARDGSIAETKRMCFEASKSSTVSVTTR